MDNNAFEKYQIFTEKTIADLSSQITILEEKLNVFTNLLEISKYINQYIKSKDLFPLINDMLIGVFGAKYSTIYIKTNNDYIPATPSEFSFPSIESEKNLITFHHEKEFIINSKTSIYPSNLHATPVFSCLGVPITVNNETLGFIIIQHQQKAYFSAQHATFLSSLANHVGVAIENNLLYNKLKETANIDVLTGIFNRRYFFETLHNTAQLDTQNYTIVMIDIDNFKHVNDTYGHLYGDLVLKTVSKIIKELTRPNDLMARYGGEEIIIFFNNFTNYTALLNRLERMRQAIETTPILDADVAISVTASFGAYIKYNETLSFKEVIAKADANLYLAKDKGKNTVYMNNPLLRNQLKT
nr:sensor domain-containing diguanylate cyclase [uncultured Cellulosilyticum sp.]